MQMSKQLYKNIFISLIILIISLSINFFLNISSFEDIYKKTLISKFKQINRELKQKIETGVNFGKPLYKFSGVENYFNDIKAENKDISHIFISNEKGKVLYSTEKDDVGLHLIDELISIDDLNTIKVSEYDERFYIYSPIVYDEKEIKGYAYIEFSKHIISKNILIMIKIKLNLFLMTLMFSALILIIILIISQKIYSDFEKKTRIVVILVLMFTQLIYSYINLQNFEKIYLKMLNKNLTNFSKSIENEVNYFSKLGLDIDQLKGFEKYLSREIQGIAEFEAIMIKSDEKIFYYANDSGAQKSYFDGNIKNKFQEDSSKYLMIRNLNKPQENINIVIKLNKKLIKTKQVDLILDTLTVLIISLIIGYQLLLFSFIKKKDYTKKINSRKYDNKIVIQILGFLFYFAEMIPLSFIPIYIERIYNKNPISIPGISDKVILGLPISIYMLGSAVSVLIIGLLSHKISERRIMLWGCFLLVIGAIGAAFSIGIVELSIFRLMSGIGYGSITITATALILRVFKDGNVATGFGFWASGYGAASLCAVPIGGVMVFRFGFRTALLVSALISASIFIFIYIFVKNRSVSEINTEKKEKSSLNIFRDKKVVSNFFLRLVPFHLVYVGIFQFMMPLIMSQKGLSAANIGRILTIFGLVYIAMPLVSKLVDRIKKDALFITFGSLIIGSVLLVIKVSQDIYALVIIVLGISVGSMIADAAEESFITSTDIAKELGETKFMSIYNSYERLIMVFSPLLSSYFVAIFGFTNSIFIIGVYTVISTIIYGIYSLKFRKESYTDEK